ncbi:MAG: serpin family protein [Thermoguttaceae bacterium]
MRTILCLLLSSAMYAPFGQTSFAAPVADTPPTVTQANNQFAVDLYGQLSKAQPGGNLFFSPASISVALAMTAAGAGGQTEAEMAQVLHLNGILPQAHLEYRKALERWNSTDKDRGYELRVANRLWGQKSFPFLASYLTLTRQEYGAELGLVDYVGQTEAARQEINAWVEKQTAEKIKDLIQKSDVDHLTRLVLTNAIYFKGDWAGQFKKDQTHDEDFTVSSARKVKVPMMHQTRRYRFVRTGALQVLELPYKGDELSMLVLLPAARDGLNDLEQSLSASRIADLQAGLWSQKVEVHLPKFRLETSFSMKTTLDGLGMRLPFTAAADFSGMDGRQDLHLSAVVHKAFVEVNEKGTEAAAATGGVLTFKAARPEPLVVFRADHPFVFMICDNRDGSILFLGRVTDPR